MSGNNQQDTFIRQQMVLSTLKWPHQQAAGLFISFEGLLWQWQKILQRNRNVKYSHHQNCLSRRDHVQVQTWAKGQITPLAPGQMLQAHRQFHSDGRPQARALHRVFAANLVGVQVQAHEQPIKQFQLASRQIQGAPLRHPHFAIPDSIQGRVPGQLFQLGA